METLETKDELIIDLTQYAKDFEERLNSKLVPTQKTIDEKKRRVVYSARLTDGTLLQHETFYSERYNDLTENFEEYIPPLIGIEMGRRYAEYLIAKWNHSDRPDHRVQDEFELLVPFMQDNRTWRNISGNSDLLQSIDLFASRALSDFMAVEHFVTPFLGNNRWIMHTVRLNGPIMSVEKLSDYRIHDWMLNKMKEEERVRKEKSGD